MRAAWARKRRGGARAAHSETTDGIVVPVPWKGAGCGAEPVVPESFFTSGLCLASGRRASSAPCLHGPYSDSSRPPPARMYAACAEASAALRVGAAPTSCGSAASCVEAAASSAQPRRRAERQRVTAPLALSAAAHTACGRPGPCAGGGVVPRRPPPARPAVRASPLGPRRLRRMPLGAWRLGAHFFTELLLPLPA